MRETEILQEIKEVTILNQFLYMSEDHMVLHLK